MLVTFGSFRVKQSSYVELFLSVSQKSRLLRLTRKTKIVNTCISRSSAEKTEWPSGRVAEWSQIKNCISLVESLTRVSDQLQRTTPKSKQFR